MSAPPRVSHEQIAALRAKRKDGALLKELAHEFKLSLNYVCSICSNRERKQAKVSQ